MLAASTGTVETPADDFPCLVIIASEHLGYG
jgi:hypothetical protein